MASKSRAIICLLRNDLRYHDNEVLSWANKNSEFVIPLYCFDPRHFKCTWHFGFPKTGPFRAKFLLESVRDLREKLKTVKSNLIVRCGKPEEVIQTLISTVNNEAIKVEAIVFQSEQTKEELDVENAVQTCCGVSVHKIWGSTFYHIDDLPFPIKRVPDVYTEFRKKVENQSRLRSTIKMPDTLKPIPSSVTEGAIPTMEELGVKELSEDSRSAFPFKGGESTGLQRLKYYLWDTDNVAKYKETRNGLIGHEYSTKFSTWLALGCLSPRRINEEIKHYESERTANQSTYWVIFELLWRDYFKFVACKFGDRIFYLSGLRGKKVNWRQDDKLFQAWKDGRTGVPFVDANMRELAATGFMSNRGRQNVASFLTKDLGLDWRLGAEWFEYLLVDHDVCSNYGNWLYSVGVGNDPRQDRKFNMIKQGLDYDPKGDYVRQWIPELSGIPGGDIHTPWRLGQAALSHASVSLGETYPMPVVTAPEWNRHTTAKLKTGPKNRPQEKVSKRGIDFYFSSNSNGGKR